MPDLSPLTVIVLIGIATAVLFGLVLFVVGFWPRKRSRLKLKP